MLLQGAIRIRVDRLLAGTASPHDVDLILADLRFMPGVSPWIVDIAHFAAHRELRDQGRAQKFTVGMEEAVEAHLKRGAALTVAPLLTEKRLTQEFKGSLIGAHILPSHRITSVKRLIEPLSLSVICAMHGSLIQLRPGVMATLALRPNATRTLEIGVSFSILQLYPDLAKPPNNAGDVRISLPLLSTNLTVDAHCEGTLVEHLKRDQGGGGDLERTIERKEGWKLTYLE